MIDVSNAWTSSSGKETFKSSKVKVIGISSDPVEKQKEFVEKQKLTVRSDGLVYISLLRLLTRRVLVSCP